MKLIYKIVCLMMLLFLFETGAHATGYYINDASTTGDLWGTAAYVLAGQNGTKTHPANTFSQLLGDVTLVAGDSVYIETGTYTWNPGFVPTASGTSGNVITIHGAGITNTKITVSAGYAFSSNSMNYITVDGIDLICSSRVFDMTANSHNWTISNCKFEATNQYGIYFNSSANCNTHTISNTTIVNSAGGIPIYATASVNNVTVTNCTLTTTGADIFHADAGTSFFTFTGCKLTNTSGTGFNIGDNTLNYTLTNDTVTTPVGKGILICSGGAVKSRNITINGGKINATGDHGIVCNYNVSSISISNISITSSNNMAINFAASADTITISSCTLVSTTGGNACLNFIKCTKVDISGTSVTHNGTGLALNVNNSSSANINIHGSCTFTSGTGSYVMYIASSPTNYQFTDCTINGNSAGGITIQGTPTNFTFTRCTITCTGGIPLRIEASSNNFTITSCTFTTGNNAAMYCVAPCTNYTVKKSTFNGNINNGAVWICSNATGLITIDSCTINNPSTLVNSYGINLTNSSQNCTISNNTINCTGTQGQRGIYSDNGSANNLFEHNVINMTTNAGANPNYGIWIGTGNNNLIKRNKIIGGDIGIDLANGGGTGIVVYNNHVSNAVQGLYCATASFSGVACYHNSFYTTKECMYGPYATWDIRNNIFYTTGNSSYSCLNIQTNDPTTLNYNVYYHPNGAYCAKRNATTYTALVANWRGVISNDANSVEGDPLYKNTVTNILEPTSGSVALGAGITIGAVPADLKASTRANPPTIGAYELIYSLPIQLLYFNGNCIDGKTNLKWATATELNNHYFTLESAEDGKNFETLSTIEGAGTSYLTNYYNSIDYPLASAGTYYRLKQTDYNGISAYSPITFVSCSNIFVKAEIISIINADNKNTITFTSPSIMNYEAELIDMNGKKIRSKFSQCQEGLNQISFDDQFSSGIYCALIHFQEEDLVLVKKIINR